eukprot:TRINITY_DN12561_c0_g1_i5.p1 TRINITY_DN12561_c0_g1~~TRINITY_DN12561_c0_g1_i5.p1  ORF type:complete len:242 (-),score=34.29 TRINITY_DN12561_c0_g1_i5:90-815(-)
MSSSGPVRRLNLVPKFVMGDPAEGLSEIFSTKFSPDGALIAAACGDCQIRVYSMTTGKLVYVLAPPGKYLKLPVTNLRWRPGNSSQRTKNVLVATYAEGITRHWHVTQSKCMDTIAEGENNLYALDYNPDATRFATGGKDYRIRVYDESTKQLCSTMTGGHNESTVGHANRIFSLKYHPRGDNMILSGGWDDTLQIWDVRVGQAVRSIYGPHICGDAIDMEGNEILTGSWRLENQIQVKYQ